MKYIHAFILDITMLLQPYTHAMEDSGNSVREKFFNRRGFSKALEESGMDVIESMYSIIHNGLESGVI